MKTWMLSLLCAFAVSLSPLAQADYERDVLVVATDAYLHDQIGLEILTSFLLQRANWPEDLKVVAEIAKSSKAPRKLKSKQLISLAGWLRERMNERVNRASALTTGGAFVGGLVAMVLGFHDNQSPDIFVAAYYALVEAALPMLAGTMGGGAVGYGAFELSGQALGDRKLDHHVLSEFRIRCEDLLIPQ